MTQETWPGKFDLRNMTLENPLGITPEIWVQKYDPRSVMPETWPHKFDLRNKIQRILLTKISDYSNPEIWILEDDPRNWTPKFDRVNFFRIKCWIFLSHILELYLELFLELDFQDHIWRSNFPDHVSWVIFHNLISNTFSCRKWSILTLKFSWII